MALGDQFSNNKKKRLVFLVLYLSILLRCCNKNKTKMFIKRPTQKIEINRGSYMSAHVLLNLLNKLGKRDKVRGLPSILSLFRNEFYKFNNTRARLLDSIYHMTLRLF